MREIVRNQVSQVPGALLAIAVCAALASVVAAVALLPLAQVHGAPIASVPSQHEPSPCMVVHRKIASPDLLLLGETVGITLTAQVLCAGERVPLHVVLVLDGSGTMAGQKSQQLKQSAGALIRSLDMPDYPSTKVAVVEFNSQARRLCGLTNSENQAVGCLRRLGASGESRIDLGINEGLRVLRQGRSGRSSDEVTEVMVVMSDGLNDAGCAPVLAAARLVRGQGILVIAICVGYDCDEQCMRQVASGPRYYFRAGNAGQLQSVFERIRDRTIRITLRKLTLRDALPDWMEYVPGSVDPPQSSPDDPDNWLEWEAVDVPVGGVTYTFEVRPLKTGYMPTNTEATGELIDSKGRSRSWVFAEPWVTVLEPELQTPPTGPPPTATSSATKTVPPESPTPATATPSAPRPSGSELYLPWASSTIRILGAQRAPVFGRDPSG